MMVPAALLLLGALTAVVAPRLLARADVDREPVVALWVWQCVVAAVLLCFALSMTLSAAVAWQAVRGRVFAPAPSDVVDVYVPGGVGGPWAAATAVALAAGGVWTAAMLAREVVRARSRLRRERAALLERAPTLPGEAAAADGLVVLEGDRPDAWWLPGPTPRLVVTTAALRRLGERELDAVLAHEQGHARARHDWLLHCSSALAGGFPRVPVFSAFRDEIHRLVELAADDSASRRHGRLAVALALVGLNEDRGVFGPTPSAGQDDVPRRVHRLITPPRRLTPVRRLGLTAAGALVPVVPVLIAFAPGLGVLHLG
ncbi:M48 family metalloprotease [Streptomyces sp. NPDC002734]|uniref:M56 family metallopeptidase n=1 Tax=Streptomyces sp. NPDC002734 TaxID=3154426 RepID=UPI00332B5ECC